MIAATLESPNVAALELTGRDYISYSAISTFQNCPLRYYFRYVAGLPEETVSASLVFGGAIHRAAEHHYNELMAGNPAPDLDTLLHEYQDAWRERDGAEILFGKKDDADTLGSLAERMLTTFQQSEYAVPAGRIIGVEEELREEVIPGCPDLLARIDLLTEDDDELVVTDLKTARSRWSQNQATDSAEQLLLYGDLAGRLCPDKHVRLQFLVITKTKQPTITAHPVAFDASRVERTKLVVEHVWQAIQAGTYYPAPSNMSCPTCPFREECRCWCG